VVESQPSKLLVAGSIPVSRSMFSITYELFSSPSSKYFLKKWSFFGALIIDFERLIPLRHSVLSC
jgi:hypothetical protein